MKKIAVITCMLLCGMAPQNRAEKQFPKAPEKLIDIHCAGKLCCFWWSDGGFGGCY